MTYQAIDRRGNVVFTGLFQVVRAWCNARARFAEKRGLPIPWFKIVTKR